MKISLICFEISAVCNMNCKFCFSDWRKNKKQLSFSKIKYIIDKLVEHGLEAINFTGGDPLLHKDIVKICKYAKEKKLMTIISTNAIKLAEDKEVLKYIDSINLPLDSFSPEIHNRMRPCSMENHHRHILELIDYICNNNPNIKIKINTMVGKPNVKDVVNIGRLLESKAYSWKLGKFLSSGFGKQFSDEFDITPEEFQKVAGECKKRYNICNVIEDYKIADGELFDMFIDSFGHVNVHNHAGISDIGEIDVLDEVNFEDKTSLNKDYLNTVYKHKKGGKAI